MSDLIFPGKREAITSNTSHCLYRVVSDFSILTALGDVVEVHGGDNIIVLYESGLPAIWLSDRGIFCEYGNTQQRISEGHLIEVNATDDLEKVDLYVASLRIYNQAKMLMEKTSKGIPKQIHDLQVEILQLEKTRKIIKNIHERINHFNL